LIEFRCDIKRILAGGSISHQRDLVGFRRRGKNYPPDAPFRPAAAVFPLSRGAGLREDPQAATSSPAPLARNHLRGRRSGAEAFL